MASKISLGILVFVTLLLLGACFLLLKRESNEGFQTQAYSVNDLDINTCPSFADEIQTAKGSTDCCQGDMVDGKCNGTTYCTKSPAYAGVLSCIDKWRQYFKDKGLNFCPATMPNYYEDIENPQSQKGCSAGPIMPNGKIFTDASAKQCKIYTSEDDNKTKIDSCYVEKMRSRVQCPIVNGNSPEATLYLDYPDRTKFIVIDCRYAFELGMPDFCAERTTLEQYFTRINPNWRTDERASGTIQELACENYIARRERAREEAKRLQEEEKKRQAAEAARRAAQAEAERKTQEASRLQQQLDEANRKLQKCK